MAKRKQVEAAQSDVAPRLEQAAPISGRVSFPIKTDGSIDWDNVPESAKERFIQTVVGDATMLEAFANSLGGAEEGGEEEEMKLTPERVGAFLDAVNTVVAFGFGWGAKAFIKHPTIRDSRGKPLPLEIDPRILMQCFMLKPEQHAELDPLLLKELNKHTDAVPDWVKEHFSLIMLLGLYGKYTVTNAFTAIKSQLQLEQVIMQRRQAGGAPPPRQPDSDVPQPPPQPENSNGSAGAVPDPIRDGIPTWDLQTAPEPPPPTV